MKERRIAGFFRQVQIILWKNLLLMSKNIFGTICELLLSGLFVLILYLIAYSSFPKLYPAKNNVPTQLNNNFYFSNQFIYYYPNNKFIRSLMNDSLKFYDDTTKPPELLGKNFSSAYDLSSAEKDNLLAMISFPSSYTNLNSLPDMIEYTIYSKE
jgi:hypothetical protein